MLHVGITGGIGSGKSTIARIFRILGIPIYNADTKAKWLMANNPQLKESIVNAFGEDSFVGNSLNRIYLAERVFNDKKLVSKLNSLVHPQVAVDFERWCTEQHADYIIKEAALLIEVGSSSDLDFMILVTAPEKLRIERIKNRDPQRSLEQIKNIMQNQMNVEDAKVSANFIIENDESQLVTPQVISIHNQLIAKGR